MPGKIYDMITMIIDERSKGNSNVASTTRTKLLLKGIDPSKYTRESDDDPVMIDKIRKCAQEMGINLKV